MFLVAQAEQLFGDTEAAALPALLESGRLPARISGLPASARALLAASMHAQLDAPVLAVCPDEAAAELFQKDLSALLGQDVPLLTARDYTFYTVESVSRQTEQKRLSALYALAAGTAPAVVCTVSGLLQRAMPKEKLLQAAFEIRDGSSLPPEDAEDALLRCGYLRTAQVEGPGQFSRRGGILDFFSPAYPQPVRVEFWGDDVDSMGFFDPESQRRTQPLESCRILPAAETLPPLYPGGSAALGEKLQKLAGRAAVKKDSDTAQKLAEALRADGEKLCADCVLPAADRYMGFVYDTFATALDYLAPEAAVLIDQPARCAERAKEYTTQLREDIALLVRSGTMAARAENFYEPFADMWSCWRAICAGRAFCASFSTVTASMPRRTSTRMRCRNRGSASSRRAVSRRASSFRMQGSPSSRTRRLRRPACGAQSIKSNPTARRSTPTPTSPLATSSCTNITAPAANTSARARTGP